MLRAKDRPGGSPGEPRKNVDMKLPLSPSPKKILVAVCNWLGDLVISLPALRAIRRSFPEAHIAILVRRNLAGFFDGFSWIDEIIAFSVRPGMSGIADHLSVIRAIRSRRFDLAVFFPKTRELAVWATLAGVPRRAGYIGDLRGPMLTHSVPRPPHVTHGHQVDHWLAMVRNTIGAIGEARDNTIEPQERNLQSMRRWLEARRKRRCSRLIAIAPGASSGPSKRWPPSYFVQLVADLVENHEAECVLVGVSSERALCEEIAAASRCEPIIAAAETEVGELIALLALCDGFVGNDSGPMHVAAALGRPTVGIFGPTDPGRTGPMGPKATFLWERLECSPCFKTTCPFGHQNCLTQIVPAKPVQTLRSLAGW